MSFDIPESIEPRIQQFAHAQHISSGEAVVRLIEFGLEQMAPPLISPGDILGAFSSPEESAAADEALEIAMSDRERRNTRALHA